MIRILLVMSVAGLSNPSPVLDDINQRRKESCGYESCPKTEPGVLNVHIVPHTHDDVGWLKTVDQYYYGTNNGIQKAGVQYIISSVVNELWEDPKRRFIYVETAFFWKWWKRQSSENRDRVRTLVREGRLQFVGGAWSMNDEAVTHYQSIIDQFTLGLGKLNETFGQCGIPRVGWQIDPFGHAKEFASLLAGMEYDGLFLGRIDYEDKEFRLKEKRMEIVWRGDDELGQRSDIFTGILYNNYSPPPGFCFDVLCNDDPIIDEPESPLYNVEKKVKQFLSYVQHQSQYYRTNNVIITMGGDFTYQDATMWYTNLDKLIEHTNKKSAEERLNVTTFYSTPDCYLKAVRDANPILPLKQDDFFPYASEFNAYWTGYYSSRPTIKYFEREANGYLQALNQLQVLAGLDGTNLYALEELKSAMGVMQHHDAVTGTEKQHVAHDYERMLDRALENALLIAKQALNKYSQNGGLKPPTLSFDRCHFNESRCYASETKQQFVVTVYNPLAWELGTVPVRLPVPEGKYAVFAPHGEEMLSQLVELPIQVTKIPSRKSNATHEIVFLAFNVPGMGYKSFYVKKYPMTSYDPTIIQRYPEDQFDVNEPIKLITSPDGGSVKVITNSGFEAPLSIQMMYYPACNYRNSMLRRASGAYVFHPCATEPHELDRNDTNKIFGPVVKEIHYTQGDFASGVVRVYKHPYLNYIEHEWLVGPIPIENHVGKDVIVRYVTDIANKDEFYTDSNGRQALKRKLNYRPDWNVTIYEPVAANYYPVTNKIAIENGKRLAVLTDRSQGGSSLKEGYLELMLHRRLLRDDALGVEESLNEIVNGVGLVVRGKHKLIFSDAGDKAALLEENKKVLENHLQPIVFVSDAENINLETWYSLKNEYGNIKNPLPKGIHVLTLEPWYESTILLRLENYLGEFDAEQTTIKVDLSNIFKNLNVTSFKETTLSANQWLTDYKKFTWKKESIENNNNVNINLDEDIDNTGKTEEVSTGDTGFNIKLRAKEIRTFVITFAFFEET